MLETPESFRPGVKAVEPPIGGDPEEALLVFQQRVDFIVADAGRVARTVFVNGEGVAVVTVQAVVGAKPEVPRPVLKAGIDLVIRQALLNSELFYGIFPACSGGLPGNGMFLPGEGRRGKKEQTHTKG